MAKLLQFLKVQARDNELDMLAYLLDLALLEATEQAGEKTEKLPEPS